MSFQRTDLERLSAIMVEAADTEIMPRFRRLGPSAVRQKSGPLDLVTDADERAELRMREAVKLAFPAAEFIGEESVEHDPSLLDRIATANLAVIVDPVDGTSNFAWGLPLFGVMAAVTVKGKTVAGLIYDPVGRDWIMAMKGSGAWHRDARGHEESLKVADPAALAELTGVCSWHTMPEPQRSRTVGNLAKSRATFGYRCSAYEYRLVASGMLHFSLQWKLMPWDHAAGVLIHAEAGGYSACLDGTPYVPTRFSGGILSAPTPEVWQVLRQELVG